MTEGTMFFILSECPHGDVLVDRDTGVMYWRGDTSNTLTMLVSEDGMPKVYGHNADARIMTLEEIQERYEYEYWLETKGWAEGDAIIPVVLISDARRNEDEARFMDTLDNNDQYVCYRSDYGKDWRCWTHRPTKKQREAEAWK